MTTLIRLRILRLIPLLWVLFFSVAFGAGSSIQSALSEEEFKNFAVKLSKNVNLFRDAWKQDPEAEFFGGTVRDYLFWLKGQFRGAKTREQAEAIQEELLNRPMIDVRDFIIGESDVDVAARHLWMDPSTYGVRKIDRIDFDRFNPGTEMGRTELHQGVIPVEKIRLSKTGFVDWSGMGNGIQEVYLGKPTVRFASAENFKSTFYAKQDLNHEILLVIRYIRTLGINYFREHGRGYPDPKLLMDIDPASEKAVREVIQRTSEDSSLKEPMKQSKFVGWFDQLIQKSFRSHTNPTATHFLFKHFGLDDFVKKYADKIEPINQYLFAQHREPDEIRKNLEKYGTHPEKLYSPVEKEFPDLTLYHGTKKEASFRSILLQGILPSADGMAGAGLYGVRNDNIAFAEHWGGSRDRIVQFQVKPSAVVVDVTKGEGLRVFQAFGGDHESFAKAFGVDIIRYKYPTRAYVVKNSASLERPKGMTRQVMTFSQAMDFAKNVNSEEQAKQLFESLTLGSFTDSEFKTLLDQSPYLKESHIHPYVSAIITDSRVPVELRGKAYKVAVDFNRVRSMMDDKSWKGRRALKKLTGELSANLDGFYREVAAAPDGNDPKWKKDFIKAHSELTIASLDPSAQKVIQDLLKQSQSEYKSFSRSVMAMISIIGPGKLAFMSPLLGLIALNMMNGGDGPPPSFMFAVGLVGLAGHGLVDHRLSGSAYKEHFVTLPQLKEYNETALREFERVAKLSPATCVKSSVVHHLAGQ